MWIFFLSWPNRFELSSTQSTRHCTLAFNFLWRSLKHRLDISSHIYLENSGRSIIQCHCEIILYSTTFGFYFSMLSFAYFNQSKNSWLTLLSSSRDLTSSTYHLIVWCLPLLILLAKHMSYGLISNPILPRSLQTSWNTVMTTTSGCRVLSSLS